MQKGTYRRGNDKVLTSAWVYVKIIQGELHAKTQKCEILKACRKVLIGFAR